MVAYDYNEQTDEIYFHRGLATNMIITDRSELFDYFYLTSMIWFEIDEDNLTHSHSYNYSGADGQSYCSCKIYSVHPSHTHGYNEVLSHTSSTHTIKCFCGYLSTSAHVKSRYVYSSQFKHEIYCACGYYMGLGTHSVVTDSPTKSHCTDCGAVFNPMFDNTLFGISPKQEGE